jgi:OOP family OmpA-OmpF porin
MNRIKLAVALLTGAGLSLSVAARDSEFYIGGGPALSRLDQGKEAPQALVDLKRTGTVDVDKRNIGGKFHFGYRYNQYLGVEAGYRDHGTAVVDFRVTAPTASTGTGKFTLKGYNIFAVLSYPVLDRLSIFGKAGINFWEWKLSAYPTAQAVKKDTGSQDPIFGLGVRYDLTDNISLRAEAERATNVRTSDPSMYSLNVEFRF